MGAKILALSHLVATLKSGNLRRRLDDEEWREIMSFIHDIDTSQADDERMRVIATLEEQVIKLSQELKDQILVRQHERNMEATRKIQDLQHRNLMSQFWSSVMPRAGGTFLIPNDDDTIDPSVIAQGTHMVNYWEGLFNRPFEPRQEDTARLERLRQLDPPIMTDLPFTMKEIHSAINRKKHSAAGMDGMLPAFLITISRGKPGKRPQPSLRPLLTLINRFYQAGQYPPLLRPRKLRVIPKGKGFPTTPADGRGIGVECAVLGIGSSMVARRAMHVLEYKLEDSIGGSRPKRGVGDLAAAMHCALTQTLKNGDRAILSATDQRKCFDSIAPETAEHFVRMYLGNGKLSDMIVATVTKAQVAVAWRGFVFPPFTANRGIPQGNACSPLILNVILDPLAKALSKVNPQWGIRVKGLHVFGLYYVDDICIITASVDDTVNVHRLIESFIRRFGMAFNPEKHVILLVCRENDPLKDQIIADLVDRFRDAQVQPDELRHLGVFYEAHNVKYQRHVTLRAAKARKTIGKAMRNGALAAFPSAESLRLIYMAFVRGNAAFALDFLPTKEQTIDKLQALERSFLGRGLGLCRNARGTAVAATMGVPTAKVFIGDLRLSRWIEALMAPVTDRTRRLLHRVAWADYILVTRHTNWPRTTPHLPLRATATINAYRLLQDDEQAAAAMIAIKDLLEEIDSVDEVPHADALQHLQTLKASIEGWKYREEQKVYDDIAQSRLPIRHLIIRERNKLMTEWNDFKRDYSSLGEWMRLTNAPIERRGEYYRKRERPYFPPIFEHMVPWAPRFRMQPWVVYKAVMGLAFGCQHWNYCLTPEEQPQRIQCPLCQETIVDRTTGLSLLSSHVLYTCTEVHRPRAAEEVRVDNQGNTVNPPGASTPLGDQEVLPGYTLPEIWTLAATLAQDRRLWALLRPLRENEGGPLTEADIVRAQQAEWQVAWQIFGEPDEDAPYSSDGRLQRALRSNILPAVVAPLRASAQPRIPAPPTGDETSNPNAPTEAFLMEASENPDGIGSDTDDELHALFLE